MMPPGSPVIVRAAPLFDPFWVEQPQFSPAREGLSRALEGLSLSDGSPAMGPAGHRASEHSSFHSSASGFVFGSSFSVYCSTASSYCASPMDWCVATPAVMFTPMDIDHLPLVSVRRPAPAPAPTPFVPRPTAPVFRPSPRPAPAPYVPPVIYRVATPDRDPRYPLFPLPWSPIFKDGPLAVAPSQVSLPAGQIPHWTPPRRSPPPSSPTNPPRTPAGIDFFEELRACGQFKGESWSVRRAEMHRIPRRSVQRLRAEAIAAKQPLDLCQHEYKYRCWVQPRRIQPFRVWH